MTSSQRPSDCLEVINMSLPPDLLQAEIQTPMAPVTLESPSSLQDLIRQDTYTLDESSKRRLQRRLQKLCSAAQLSFAERSLQQDQIRFLSDVNDEARVR